MSKQLKKIILFFSIPVLCFGQGSYNFAKIDSIGNAIESTISAKDKSYINQLFDVELFAERFLMASENEMVLNYNTAFLDALKESFDLGKILVNKGEYNYMRLYIDGDNQFHLMFRLFTEDGINYHDYLIQRVDERYKLVDVYVFYTGRNLSDTYRDRYLETLAEQDFFESNREFKKATKAYEKYLNFIDKEQYKKAYLASFDVSEHRQQTKPFKLLQLRIAKELSPEVLTDVLADFEQSFPNDPSLALRMVDYYYEIEAYDKSLESVEMVNKAVDGDYFLDIYRGNIHYAKGDLKQAKAYFTAVIENFPYFVEAYDLLFAVYVKLKQNDEAVSILNIMIKNFGYTKSELIDYILDEFPNFTRTTAYQNWQ